MFNREKDSIDDVEEYLKSRKSSENNRDSRFIRNKTNFNRVDTKERHTEIHKRTENHGDEIDIGNIASSMENRLNKVFNKERILGDGRIYNSSEVYTSKRASSKRTYIDSMAYTSLAMAFMSIFFVLFSFPTFILSIICLFSKRKQNRTAVNICAGISLVVSLIVLFVCVILFIGFASLLVEGSYNWS